MCNFQLSRAALAMEGDDKIDCPTGAENLTEVQVANGRKLWSMTSGYVCYSTFAGIVGGFMGGMALQYSIFRSRSVKFPIFASLVLGYANFKITFRKLNELQCHLRDPYTELELFDLMRDAGMPEEGLAEVRDTQMKAAEGGNCSRLMEVLNAKVSS